MNMNKLNPIAKILILLISFSLILGLISAGATSSNSLINKYTVSELKEEIKEGNVSEITMQPSNGIYKISGVVTEGDIEKKYTTDIVTEEAGDFVDFAKENEVDVVAKEAAHTTALGNFMGSLIMFIIIMFALSYLMKRMTSGKNSPMAAGEHKARLNVNSGKTFKDVIGYEEEKQELYEIVDFLKNPDYYIEMGAKIPNGVLLEGPPGTGKTLMAKAVAGEAGVNFYSISGSDFIEMFVGVGASRVRSLFNEAKKNGPAIVFIDEIDAIGSRDSGAPGGRNTEQEQTINALLVELDGFATDRGKGQIIIIGATNRADKLDPALLRVGRFDRKVMMGLPELKAREEILRFHAKTRTMAPDIDFKDIARSTTGMAGSNLEGVINEAAILAVRKKAKIITKEDMHEAIDRVLMGPAKINNKYSEKDKKMVAYHESGHAIIGLELDQATEVQKITIIPRGNAGGYVAYVPKEEEERFTSKSQLDARLVSLMGGRASEELFIGDVTLGAHNDFEQATRIARAMVTEYGMSSLGHRQFEMRNDNQFLKAFSEQTAREIDDVISSIIEEAYQKAKEILLKRKDDVALLADAICERETMTKSEIDYLILHRELKEIEEVETYSDEEIDAIVKKRKEERKQETENKDNPKQDVTINQKDEKVVVDKKDDTINKDTETNNKDSNEKELSQDVDVKPKGE